MTPTPEEAEETLRRLGFAQRALLAEARLVAQEIGVETTVAALLSTALRLAIPHHIPLCTVNMRWAEVMCLALTTPEAFEDLE
jgi:hypothetical protein